MNDVDPVEVLYRQFCTQPYKITYSWVIPTSKFVADAPKPTQLEFSFKPWELPQYYTKAGKK